MNPFLIALIVLVCTFGAGLVGLRVRIPERHLNDRTTDALKNIMGLIATVSALVLGLLVASASASYDRQSSELRTLSANLILLDSTLAIYGPGARPARDSLRAVARQMHDRIWSRDGVHPEDLNSPETRRSTEAVLAQIEGLRPGTDSERTQKTRALQEAEAIGAGRLLMFTQLGTTVAWPLLIVLIFWLSMLFFGTGLLSDVNATIAVALFVGAVSVAAALFVIQELGDPYHGLLRITDQPFRNAIAQIDQPQP